MPVIELAKAGLIGRLEPRRVVVSDGCSDAGLTSVLLAGGLEFNEAGLIGKLELSSDDKSDGCANVGLLSAVFEGS